MTTGRPLPVRRRAHESGVLLGMSVRQAVPLVAGVLWLTLMLMVGLPIVGAARPGRRRGRGVRPVAAGPAVRGRRARSSTRRGIG